MNAPASTNCSACGKAIASTRLRGLCAACLVRGVTDGGDGEGKAEGAMFRIPGHDVLEEIARGGMGIVYRARQHDPAREVALKMLLPGGATPALRERFRNEARTMADLDHPGVLPLYQFGEHGGTPWFTMKLAAGGSLADKMKDQSNLTDPRAAASLMADLAEAVAYAHQRGVLHRDLKPGNILFDGEGRAYVADFGLAKLTSASAGLTQSRAMLGTPHYLAPELAAKAGTTATVATDVYALGAILYELLAGRPPFQAETMAGLLRSIIEDDPPSLLAAKTSLAGMVPRGLAAIAGKAMAKEPARRYRDAAALAADLRAWLSGEAIEARPPGAREKFLRWVQKHPALAASLALLAAGLSAIIFLQAKSARDLRAERDVAEASQQRALAAKAEALSALVASARASGRLDGRDAALVAAREAAALRVTDQLRDDVITLLATPGWAELGTLEAGRSDYVPLTAEHDFMVANVEGRLTLHDLSGRQPSHPLPPLASAVETVSFVTSGAAFIACRTKEGRHHLYDRAQDRWVREWQTRVWGFVLSQDEKLLAWSEDGGKEIVIEDWRTGEIRQRLNSTKSQPAPRAFSPDGKWLAAGGFQENGLDVIDLSTGAVKHSLLTMLVDQGVANVAWRPDSRGLAAAMGAADLYAYALDAKDPVRERVAGHQAEALDVTWHPDGRWFASCGFDGTVRVWESPSRREVLRVPVMARSVRFSRDGTRLACLEWNGGKVHRFAFTAPVCTVQCPLPRTSADTRRQRPSWGCAVTPDGLLGVSVSDFGLHWFHAATGARLGWQTAGYPLDLRFNAAGDMLFATGPQGVLPIPVKRAGALGREVVLPVNVSKFIAAEPPHLYSCRGSWSEARQRLAWTAGQTACIKDMPDGPVRLLPVAPFALNPCALSPDGQWLVCSGGDNAPDGLVIWNADAPAAPRVLPGFSPYTYLCFSPDSRRLYAYTDDRITALATGGWEPVWTLDRSGLPASQHQMALSGDGLLLACVEPLHGLGLYETATGRRIAALRHPDVRWIGWLAFDYTGARLLVTTLPDSVISWDLRTLRRQLAELGLDWQMPAYPPAPAPVKFGLKFLPDPDAPPAGP